MSYIQHNCIVVTGSQHNLVREAYDLAQRLFGNILVSNIIGANYQSFFIAPDDNRKGSEARQQSDALRLEYIGWLKQNELQWVELFYGNEFGTAGIVRDCGETQRRRQELKSGMLIRELE